MTYKPYNYRGYDRPPQKLVETKEKRNDDYNHCAKLCVQSYTEMVDRGDLITIPNEPQSGDYQCLEIHLSRELTEHDKIIFIHYFKMILKEYHKEMEKNNG